MSTLKVNSIDTESGTTITVPTGKVFTITDNSGISIGGTAVTSTAAELNVLDGIPAGLTATELGYVDGVTSGIQAQVDAKLPLAGGTLTGTLTTAAVTAGAQISMADNILERPVVKDYGESYNASSGQGTVDLDLTTGNVFQHTASGGNVTFTFSNPPASGTSGAFTLKWIQDSSDRTATWPTEVDWAGATAPTLTSGSAKVDIFTFFTVDGGTTWYGFIAGQDMG